MVLEVLVVLRVGLTGLLDHQGLQVALGYQVNYQTPQAQAVPVVQAVHLL